MPAPTALKAAPEELAANVPHPTDSQDEEELMLDAPSADPASNSVEQATESTMQLDDTVDEEGRPRFAPASSKSEVIRVEHRKCPIPAHRLTPLKSAWPKIYAPLVEKLQLQCRFNLKSKCVELRTSKVTTDMGAIQKGADFVRAFALGFEVDDAIALLRLDDLYIESFEIKDVRTLQGDHLARALGRICGSSGKTKYAIENASRTRISVCGSRIHILGAFKNTRIARESIVSLILGKPPGKVYNGLRTVSARMKERF